MSISKNQEYKRKVTPNERFFRWAPYSTVSMVAKIKGNVSKEMLINAVKKVQQRHTLLQVRIQEDNDGEPWFVSDNVEEIQIDEVKRESSNTWQSIITEYSKIPYDFEMRPPIRFVLVKDTDKELSELVILCHHIICDGMSLAYLARDIMTHLGDPNKEVELLPEAVPITKDNLPDDVLMGGFMQKMMAKIKAKWDAEKVTFDKEDYQEINKTYWNKFEHKMLVVEMSEEETAKLVKKCREEKVTVNSAITAAFMCAQNLLQDKKSFDSNIAIAGSHRKYLKEDVGEVMGFYAGGFAVKGKYNNKKSFWDNARLLHKNVKSKFVNKNLFREVAIFEYIEPTIWEGRNFKILGKFVPEDSPKYNKLYEFGNRDDTLLSLMKRSNIDSLDKTIIGTAITNLTRMEFPVNYGSLELERLIFHPGGGFPLVTVNLVIGAVTCSGKLSILLEYAEDAIDTPTMEKIRKKSLEFLQK